jgi:probable rRNA maturation factor
VLALNLDVGDAPLTEWDAARLQSVVEATLVLASASDEVQLSITLTDDAVIQRLNRQFRGVDAPTDVLSFGSGPVAGFVQPEVNTELGDIVISYPTALRQADAMGHPVIEELALLVTHGTLHLLGYDHADQDEQRTMWTLQDQVLFQLGLRLKSYVPEEPSEEESLG